MEKKIRNKLEAKIKSKEITTIELENGNDALCVLFEMQNGTDELEWINADSSVERTDSHLKMHSNLDNEEVEAMHDLMQEFVDNNIEK